MYVLILHHTNVSYSCLIHRICIPYFDLAMSVGFLSMNIIVGSVAQRWSAHCNATPFPMQYLVPHLGQSQPLLYLLSPSELPGANLQLSSRMDQSFHTLLRMVCTQLSSLHSLTSSGVYQVRILLGSCHHTGSTTSKWLHPLSMALGLTAALTQPRHLLIVSNAKVSHVRIAYSRVLYVQLMPYCS